MVRTMFGAAGVRAPFHGGFDIGRMALFLDVDGTLLDIAERPDAVTVPSGLVETLAAARTRTGGALALISGRSIADIDRLFAPLRLPASGVHGAELRLDPNGEAVAEAAGPLPPTLWAELNEALADLPGTFAENKRYSYAVHYREAPWAEGTLRARLERLLEVSPQPGITMLGAHAAFELKQPQFDKGHAIRKFLERSPFQGRMAVFIGDDETDEAGFAAVSSLGGQGLSVGEPRPGAEATFASPEAVRRWLAAFAAGGAST